MEFIFRFHLTFQGKLHQLRSMGYMICVCVHFQFGVTSGRVWGASLILVLPRILESSARRPSAILSCLTKPPNKYQKLGSGDRRSFSHCRFIFRGKILPEPATCRPVQSSFSVCSEIITLMY